MDDIRTQALRILDEVILVLRNGGQSFAFFSDGRDMVEVIQTEEGPVAQLSDHEDEGWPPVEFPLHPSARFFRGVESVLSRSVAFVHHDGKAEVVAALKGAGLEMVREDGEDRARLGSCALLRVHGWRHDGLDSGREHAGTIVTVTQRRSPEAIRQALRAKMESMARPR
jgi:hypothetical protein